MKESLTGQFGRIIGLFFGLCTVLTVWFQIETVHQLEGWRWQFQTAAVWDWGVTGIWIMMTLTLVWACIKTEVSWIKMFLLFVLGVTVQWGPVLSTGEGISGLEDRALTTGHREFSVIASHQLDFLQVLEHYETLASAPSQRFARSKPPGQLMGYMLFERLADRIPFSVDTSNEHVVSQAHGKLVRVLALVMPLLAALSLLLVYRLAVYFVKMEQAIGIAIAYALTPSFALIQLHFDQAVYPLLCLGMWLWTVRTGRTWAEGLGLGILIYLSTFISFSLLPAVLLLPFLLWMFNRKPRLVWGLGVISGGLSMLCLGLFGGYLPWVRYSAAMVHHSTWKNWIWDPWLVAQFSLLNGVEWLWWIGGPLVSLMLIDTCRLDSSLNLPLKRLGWSLLLVFILLFTFGQTIGEVARLWCFLVPLGLIWGGGQIGRYPKWILGTAVVLQLLLIAGFRHSQDFW